MESIDAFLEPGERLLWHGRPDSNRLVRRQYLWCFFAGAFFGLSLIWCWASWQQGTVISMFIGVAFAAMGLAVVYSKAREILNARTTRYLVTDRRAVVLVGKSGQVLESFSPSEVGKIEVRPVDDEFSDVLFNREPRLRGYRGVTTEGTGFYGLADPQQARKALETLAQGDDAAA